MNSALFTSEKDYWETPQELFDKLDKEFNFTLDPCSTHQNAKCKKHYTMEENGLSKSWGGGRQFLLTHLMEGKTQAYGLKNVTKKLKSLIQQLFY